MNVLELIEELGIDHRASGESPHVTPGWIGLVCPYCGEGTGKHGLGIHLERGNATCWKCGPHPTAEVLAEITKRSVREMGKLLGQTDRPILVRTERPRGTLVLPKGLGPMSRCHRRYLRGRDFDPDEMARLWGVLGIGLCSRLAWRLFVPITQDGRTVSWLTRSVRDDADVRYINARPDEEEVPAKEVLYGADRAGHAIMVVEGFTDAWRIGNGAGATLGTSYSREQVTAIARFPIRVACFDNDPEAQRRAKSLCETLSVLPGRTFNVQIDAKDPAAASPREIRKLREEFLE